MKTDANRILPLDHPDLQAHLTDLAIGGEFGRRDWHDVTDFEDMPLLLPANDNDRSPKRCPPDADPLHGGWVKKVNAMHFPPPKIDPSSLSVFKDPMMVIEPERNTVTKARRPAGATKESAVMKTNRNEDTRPTEQDVARAFAELPVEILFALADALSPGREVGEEE
jgi:hypothetical protein